MSALPVIKVEEAEQTFQFSDDQAAALEKFGKFLKSGEKFFSIVGPAGSGKSTIVKEMIRMASKVREMKLSAPTHKAAQNLREITSMPVGTIHSLLCAKIKRNFTTGEQWLAFDEDRLNVWDFEDALVIIDEASMLGIDLLKMINSVAKSVNVKFLFVGDMHQLKPIGEGDSMAVNPKLCTWAFAELTKVHRQAAENPVLALATAIRLGESSLTDIAETVKDNTGVFVLPFNEWRERLIENCKDSASNNRSVAFTNKYTDMVNTAVRKAAFGGVDDIPPYLPDELMVSNSRIARDDEALAENNEEIVIQNVEAQGQDMFNEPTEFELTFLNSHQESVSCRAMRSYEDRKQYLSQLSKRVKRGDLTWKEFYAESDLIADLRPVYSGTVHKSQGSTYNDTYINLTELAQCRDPVEHRRLLYVAVTRASSSVYLTH